jgi:hypothetical protein
VITKSLRTGTRLKKSLLGSFTRTSNFGAWLRKLRPKTFWCADDVLCITERKFMFLNSGELFTLAVDPMIILMAQEAETVEDEFEVVTLSEQRETVLLAAQAYTSIRQSQE